MGETRQGQLPRAHLSGVTHLSAGKSPFFGASKAGLNSQIGIFREAMRSADPASTGHLSRTRAATSKKHSTSSCRNISFLRTNMQCTITNCPSPGGSGASDHESLPEVGIGQVPQDRRIRSGIPRARKGWDLSDYNLEVVANWLRRTLTHDNLSHTRM